MYDKLSSECFGCTTKRLIINHNIITVICLLIFLNYYLWRSLLNIKQLPLIDHVMLGEKKLTENKGVIRGRNSKKERQHNSQKYQTLNRKKRLHNTHHTKTRGELGCPRRVSSPCSTSGTHRFTHVHKPVIRHEWGNDWNELTTHGTCVIICDTVTP
jgi:hypothetical protein